MAKPEVKKPEETQRIFLVYKGDTGGEYASGFIVEELDLNKDLITKHGKSISKSEPDLFRNCLNTIEWKVRSALGL